MAKALIGYIRTVDPAGPRLVAENDRLRARVGELEASTLRLTEENDTACRTATEAVDEAGPRQLPGPHLQQSHPAGLDETRLTQRRPVIALPVSDRSATISHCGQWRGRDRRCRRVSAPSSGGCSAPRWVSNLGDGLASRPVRCWSPR